MVLCCVGLCCTWGWVGRKNDCEWRRWTGFGCMFSNVKAGSHPKILESLALKVWLPCCRTVRGIECPLVCFVIGGQLTRVARY